MRLKWLLMTFALLLGVSIALTQQSPAATTQAPPPVLFFSDLISGPATGNSDTTFSSNGGVYVTLYGNFLSPVTSVTLNGTSCLTVVSQPTTWLWYQRMVVQLTNACTSGNLVLTTPNGSSNGLSFTVTAGNIYYVDTAGNDSNAGAFSSPWATLPHAVQTAGLSPGNIVYVRSNVTQTADDGQWNGDLTIRAAWSHGSASQPDALLSYPGATGIQIGSTTTTGFDTSDFTAADGGPAGYWTIAGLTMIGDGALAIRSGTQWRFIGNDVSCPASVGGGGGYGCFETSLVTNFKTFGNDFHDMGPNATDRLFQGVYYSTDSDHIEHAWNMQSNSGGRTSLQTHSSPLSSGNGYILYDINIHDNTFHDAREECVLVDTVDPSQGAILIWNNVVYNCGKDGSGDSLHLQLSGDFDTSHGAGTSPPPVQWYNNTVFVSSSGSSCWGSAFPDIHSGFTTTDFLQNNICYVSGTAAYWDPGNYSGSTCSSTDTAAQCKSMSGKVNLVFGNGAPTFLNLMSDSLNVDPLFVVTGSDFHLQSGSPAIAAGSTVAPIPTYDIEGKPRSVPPSIGAYEFNAGAIPVKPNPPTNLSIAVK